MLVSNSLETIATAAAVGGIFSWLFWKEGRVSYRVGLYFCLGYLALSVAEFIAADGDIRIYELVLIPVTAMFAYFFLLGVLVTFGARKPVKCMRCQYVGYAWEIDQPREKLTQDELRRFEALAAEVRLEKKTAEALRQSQSANASSTCS